LAIYQESLHDARSTKCKVIPIAVYTELFLLMMSSVPARNT